MRKIVAAFEASDLPEGVMRFISSMNITEQVAVTGLFYPASIYAQLWKYADTSAGMMVTKSDDPDAQAAECVEKFKEFCTTHHLRHIAMKNTADFGLQELTQQSRFADLIIISSEHFFNIPNSDKPSEYIKNFLHQAECPVVIVPDGYRLPRQNILTFDGSASSAKAIRNFAYLFPEFERNETVVVTFGQKNTVDEEQVGKMKELMSVHFPHYKFVQSLTDSDKYLNWKNDHKPAVVVCGAFGRSTLSTLFRHSFISDVLQNRKMPVFISHK